MIIVSGRWTPAKNLLLQPCHFNRCSVGVLLLFPAKSDGIAETAVAPINVEWVENVGATCNLCQCYFCWQSNPVLCGSGIYYRCLTFVFTFSKLFFLSLHVISSATAPPPLFAVFLVEADRLFKNLEPEAWRDWKKNGRCKNPVKSWDKLPTWTGEPDFFYQQ